MRRKKYREDFGEKKPRMTKCSRVLFSFLESIECRLVLQYVIVNGLTNPFARLQTARELYRWSPVARVHILYIYFNSSIQLRSYPFRIVLQPPYILLYCCALQYIIYIYVYSHHTPVHHHRYRHPAVVPFAHSLVPLPPPIRAFRRRVLKSLVRRGDMRHRSLTSSLRPRQLSGPTHEEWCQIDRWHIIIIIFCVPICIYITWTRTEVAAAVALLKNFKSQRVRSDRDTFIYHSFSRYLMYMTFTL